MPSPQSSKLVQINNGEYSFIGVQDANGYLAIGMTPFYQTPSGILVAGPADANGNPLHALTIKSIKPISVHSAASAPETGQTLQVSGYSVLTLEVYGASSAAGLMEFQGASTSANYTPVRGERLSDGHCATSTSSFPSGSPLQPDQWRFDVSGLVTFQCPLITVSAGTITVQGNLLP